MIIIIVFPGVTVEDILPVYSCYLLSDAMYLSNRSFLSTIITSMIIWNLGVIHIYHYIYATLQPLCQWQRYKEAPDSMVYGAYMGPTWADRTQVGPRWATWTLLYGTPLFRIREYNKLVCWIENACYCKAQLRKTPLWHYIQNQIITPFIHIYIKLHRILSVKWCYGSAL